MATRGMFSTTDLRPLLAERGIDLSTSQVYRLVVDKPERLSLPTLMALIDILECQIDDLIDPVPVARPGRARRAAGAGEPDAGPGPEAGPGVAGFRPRRARVDDTTG